MARQVKPSAIAAGQRGGASARRPAWRDPATGCLRMTTGLILVLSGILIGAGFALVWRDIRRSRRQAFLSEHDTARVAEADVEITIARPGQKPPRRQKASPARSAARYCLGARPVKREPRKRRRSWTTRRKRPSWPNGRPCSSPSRQASIRSMPSCSKRKFPLQRQGRAPGVTRTMAMALSPHPDRGRKRGVVAAGACWRWRPPCPSEGA